MAKQPSRGRRGSAAALPPIRWGEGLRAFLRDRSASIAPIFAIAATIVLATGGAGLDFGRQFNARSNLQDEMDEAVLAGAAAGSSTAVTVAKNALAADGAPVGLTASKPSFQVNADGSVTGSVTGTVQTYLLGLVGISSLSVSVSSTASAASASYLSMGNVCVLLKDTSAQGVTQNSGANINASGCAIAVQSTASPAAMFNSGSTFKFDDICIAGANVTSNGGAPANLNKSCTTVGGKTVTDPYAGKLPTPADPTCTYSNMNYNGGSVIFTPTNSTTPVVFCGNFNLNSAPSVTFKPGIYVFKGSTWNVDGGTWTGSGVTFYFADSSSKIQFNSGINATLSAPSSGTYQGLLFYEPTGLSKTQWVFDDSKGNNLSGLMYLPSRQVTYNSGSNANGDSLAMVFDTLMLDSTNWTLNNSTTGVPAPGSAGTTSVYLKS